MTRPRRSRKPGRRFRSWLRVAAREHGLTIHHVASVPPEAKGYAAVLCPLFLRNRRIRKPKPITKLTPTKERGHTIRTFISPKELENVAPDST